jgi:hypothetical protein
MPSTASTNLRLRDQVRRVIRLNRYSVRTEKSYWYWIRYYIRFHGVRHPQEMGANQRHYPGKAASETSRSAHS